MKTMTFAILMITSFVIGFLYPDIARMYANSSDSVAEHEIIPDPVDAVIKLTLFDAPGTKSGCTMFHVGSGYYVTAAHCVKLHIVDDMGFEFMPRVVDLNADVAILFGHEALASLKISPVDERYWGENVTVLGYPSWIGSVFFAEPTQIIAIAAQNDHVSKIITQAVCAPGCSGGPLLTQENKVVALFIGFLTNEYGNVGNSYSRDYSVYVATDAILRNLELAIAMDSNIVGPEDTVFIE